MKSHRGSSRTLVAVLALVLLVAGAGRSQAHEFWIEPSTFRPAAGELVTLVLQVGEGFAGEVVPRIDSRIERFVSVSRERTVPVRGLEGKRIAGIVRPATAGDHIVAYVSRPVATEIEPKHFETYLLEDGLERALAERRDRGERDEPGRERYTRCAKALLGVGGAMSASPDRALGLPVELIALSDPGALAGAGGSFEAELRFKGKPSKDALVVAVNREDPGRKLRARSDSRGRVRFDLPRGGAWLISAVVMRRVEAGDSLPSADWESFWASLTFEAPIADVAAAEAVEPSE